ncbi:MAG: GWxTD domain-containing protein [Ignavibacteriaceae bacterium]|nr:GWxTD domain-containing protein [Ignavibacteriaceae bacterium]
MIKLKTKTIFLCIIIAIISFPQNRQRSPDDYPNPENFRLLYSEINVLPSVNDNWVYYYTFRIPYNHLVFVKDDKGYKAGFSLAIEVTDTAGNFADRQIMEDKIEVNNYEETGSELLFYQGMLTFHLPKKNYNFLPIITDVNSRDESKLKKIEIFTGTERYKNLLPPLVVNSKKVKCGSNEVSVLTNFDGYVPFSNSSYDIIFPSTDTSLQNIKAIVINNGDTLFNGYLKESSVYNINLHLCDSQLVIGKKGGVIPTKNFIMADLSPRFMEGNLIFNFFKEEGKKPFVTQNRQCLWFDKPMSLRNPEFAIKILKYITGNDSINKMLDAKEKDYPKVLYKFWKRYDPTPSTNYNEVMIEYYKRVDYTAMNFSTISNKKGFDTDRGKVYIQMGTPKKIERSSDSDGKVIEAWYYGQNKKFIFIDKQGTGDFSLQGG